MAMDPLPTARLVPRDAADHATILRARAGEGVRRAGRVAGRMLRLSLFLGACSVCLVLIGTGSHASYRSTSNLDRQLDRIQKMQDAIAKMPKFDPKLFEQQTRID